MSVPRMPSIACDQHVDGWRRTRLEALSSADLVTVTGGIGDVGARSRGGLMARVDPSQLARLCARPHTQPFEMRDVEMKSWLRVDGEGLRTKRQLESWVSRGGAYARSLPPKG